MMVSKAQNRYMHWADQHPGEAGIKPGVAEKFIADSHGQQISKLPERVQHRASGGHIKPTRW